MSLSKDDQPQKYLKVVNFSFPMVDYTYLKAHPYSCWISPYFYSSKNGYKLCISVDANGSGTDQNGQQVAGRFMSLYVHLMPGPYDQELSWPFIGDIAVTLKKHTEEDDVIDFTDTDSLTNSSFMSDLYKSDIFLTDEEEDWVNIETSSVDDITDVKTPTEDYKKVIQFAVQEDWVGARVSWGSRSEFGWGHPTFISHDELCDYIENDTILFEIRVTQK